MTHCLRNVLVSAASLALVSAASFAQTPAPRAGEVTALLPLAQIHRGTVAPFPAQLRGQVRWRDLMETQPRARARVELLDGSILNIGSAARVLIVRHDQQSRQTDIELALGKMRAVVGKLTRADSAFTLRTNTAVVGVIGTHVYAEAQPDATTVINLDTGRSRVRSTDPTIAGEQVLEPFELTTVARGEPPTPKRPATFEEILQAMLDTLPGLILPVGPGHARAGSCTRAVTPEPLTDADGDGFLARSPFLQATPGPCAGDVLTPVRVCVPADATPGLYEFALPTAAGERLSAFLVRPAEPPNRLEGAHFVYAPEAPPGSVHYPRLLDAQNRPLAGVPVRLKSGDLESVVHTDASGGFTVRVPESGSVEMEVDVAGKPPAPTHGPALPPITARVQAVDLKADDLRVPEVVQRGGVVNVPGELAVARLGERRLPVVRTVTRAGRTISTVAMPPEILEGPSNLVLEDARGQRQQHRLVVFDILSAQLAKPGLTSGEQTAGAFIACVGGAPLKTVRARIVARGPVRFRGKGAKGKVYQRKLRVGAHGLVRIPFQIRAQKGAPGAGVPFTLRLTLTR
ncbi:MAG: FecR domain-containing protein [Terriglobia bacterium]